MAVGDNEQEYVQLEHLLRLAHAGVRHYPLVRLGAQ